MDQFLELLWRSFAVALGVMMAAVIAFIVLGVLAQYVQNYRKSVKPKIAGDERIALLNEAFNTGLAILQIDGADALQQSQYGTLRDWMQSYVDAKRVKDKVSFADVTIIHAQSVMPSPGLIEQWQRTLEGKR